MSSLMRLGFLGAVVLLAIYCGFTRAAPLLADDFKEPDQIGDADIDSTDLAHRTKAPTFEMHDDKLDTWKDNFVLKQEEDDFMEGSTAEGSGQDLEIDQQLASQPRFKTPHDIEPEEMLSLRPAQSYQTSFTVLDAIHSSGMSAFHENEPEADVLLTQPGHNNTTAQSAFNTIFGFLDQERGLSGSQEDNEIITIWINLKTGQIVGSTLNSLEKGVLQPLLGKERVEYVSKQLG